jgi:N-acetyl-alpha-D-muramate 1-phosphate uridylyltransferase
MQCVILAGGLGTRMRSTAPDTAKAMIPVAGKPFIAWQLEWLGSQGVHDVVLSIGYKGEQIRSYVKAGEQFDVSVGYVDEGDRLLGTAGALRRALDNGALSDRFFVLYGDSYLDVSLAKVWRHVEQQEYAALMTVYRNSNVGEVSNVVFDGTRVTRYAKNLTTPPDDMVFVDYGLLVFSRSLIEDHVASDTESDLSRLLESLSAEGSLAGYEATARFFEIGSPEGLGALERELRSRPSDPELAGS